MNTIIIIDRQFGSGGLEIARRIAEKRGIPCFDRELIERAAVDRGLTKEQIENQDERPGSGIIFGLIADTMYTRPLEEEVFLAEREAIRKIARESKDGCVIVGRCADIALSRHTNLVSIFIHASEAFRMERVRSGKAGGEDGINYRSWSDEKLLELLKKKDKERWSYYDSHAQRRWGQAKNYDFTINSAFLVIEGSVKHILALIDDFEQEGEDRKEVP